MATMSPKEWMGELTRLQRTFRQVRERVRESKIQGELYGSSNVKRRYRFKQDVRRVEGKVTKLDKLLTLMEDMPRKYEIGDGELTRRRGLLTRLKNDVLVMSNMLARSRPIQEREDLNLSQVEEDGFTDEQLMLSNQQLIQRQRNEDLKQEQHLDEILQGVTTLKGIGQNINTELSFQGELLDGLEAGVDKTDRNIQRNTASVQSIARSSSSCWPMFIMIFLLFVIVFLLVI
mmetsp:Transcript_9301/g.13957  ORF Transcript_9301/g.13957 Transcript_9301/m.13957 type:complete len:232 (-) Transcript_9301:156-851(-)